MAFTRYTAPVVSPVLGRAEGYELVVVDRTLRRRIRPVPFNTLRWGRVEADSSRLSASIPAWGEVPLRGVLPWQHGLAVVRNGVVEWAGPITNVRRASGAEKVDLSAFDILGWTMKRFVRSVIDMPTADYGLVFDRLVEEATLRDNVFQLTSSTPPTGVAGDKSYSGSNNDQIFSALQELGRNGMDFTVAGLSVISGPTGRLFTGFTPLDEGAFIGRIGAELDGMSQTNSARTAAGGTGGSEGFTTVAEFEEWTARSGLLESFESEADVRDFDGALASARGRWDAFHDAPLIVSFPPLSPNFPTTMAELIPGKVFRLQIIDPLFDLAGDYRLTQLDVEVSVGGDGSITEEISVEMEKVQGGPAAIARERARQEPSTHGGEGETPPEEADLSGLWIYDTRTWDGLPWGATFHGDGEIENLGTGETPDGGNYYMIVNVGGGFMSPNLFHDGGGIDAVYDVTDIDWSYLGGTIQSTPWTFGFAIGDSVEAGGGGFIEYEVEIGPSFELGGFGLYCYVFTDQVSPYTLIVTSGWDLQGGSTGGFVYELLDEAIPPGTMVFIEYDLADSASQSLWVGETLIGTNTTTGLGTSIDDLWPDINGVYMTLEICEDTITPGDPFPMTGYFMRRGTINETDREGWRAYYFD